MKEIAGLDLVEALGVLKGYVGAIKVGSKDGAAFFYCGTVDDFAENISLVSEQQLHNFERHARKAQLSLEVDIRHIPTPPHSLDIGECAEVAYKHAANVDSNGRYLSYLIDLGKWASKVSDRRSTASKAKWRLDNFKPLRERYVKEIYYADPAADAERPLCIIINGYEFGRYWTMEEAANE